MPRQSRPDGHISVWGPAREWWVYNPGFRLDICLSEGVYDFVFHQKTYQFKPNLAISPSKHLTMLAPNYPWRAILVDYHEKLALFYQEHWRKPAGVFPVWSARDSTRSLLRLLDRYPAAGDPVGVFTGTTRLAVAVEGQEQRVMLCNFPRYHKEQWEAVFVDLMSAKRDFPHIIFHFNGQKSIPRTLGTGVDSFDHPVTIDWIEDQPRLLMANGKICDYTAYKKSGDHRKWARLVGIDAQSIFETTDRLKKSRRMYLFNLRSLKWSFANFEKVWSMRVVDEEEINTDDPDSSWVPVDLSYRPRTKEIHDKWVCDLCSISHRCPYSRPGAVCIVDDTEGKQLVSKFRTRNSADIIDALGGILSAQEARAHRALAHESKHNEEHPEDARFSPEVTKMLATTFDQGVTLARLVDPTLVSSARGRKVIDIQAHESLAGATPRELAAAFADQIGQMEIPNVTEDDAAEALRRMLPTSRISIHVDDDDETDDGSGRDPVASSQSPVRAAPRLDP